MYGRCVTSDHTHNLFYQNGVCLVVTSVLLTAEYRAWHYVSYFSNSLHYFPRINCGCCQLQSYNYYLSDATSLLGSTRPCKLLVAIKRVDGGVNVKESHEVENKLINQWFCLISFNIQNWKLNGSCYKVNWTHSKSKNEGNELK